MAIKAQMQSNICRFAPFSLLSQPQRRPPLSTRAPQTPQNPTTLRATVSIGKNLVDPLEKGSKDERRGRFLAGADFVIHDAQSIYDGSQLMRARVVPGPSRQGTFGSGTSSALRKLGSCMARLAVQSRMASTVFARNTDAPSIFCMRSANNACSSSAWALSQKLAPCSQITSRGWVKVHQALDGAGEAILIRIDMEIRRYVLQPPRSKCFSRRGTCYRRRRSKVKRAFNEQPSNLTAA
jgi:hypothetical protein